MLLLSLGEGSLGHTATKFSRDDFPPDFVFGAGTSAYQVGLLSLSLWFPSSDDLGVKTIYVLICRWREQQLRMEGVLAYGILSLMQVGFLFFQS